MAGSMEEENITGQTDHPMMDTLLLGIARGVANGDLPRKIVIYILENIKQIRKKVEDNISGTMAAGMMECLRTT